MVVLHHPPLQSMNHVTELNKESFIIESCITCNRKYTRAMMIRNKTEYECIVCSNRKDYNVINTKKKCNHT